MSDVAPAVPIGRSGPAVAEEERLARLLDVLGGYGRVAVAFSAGVDSTVVAQAAALACGDAAVAVTGASPSLAAGELDEARELARRIGIRHVVVRTDEFSDPDYARNPANRCFYCKTELYGRMAALRDELGFDVIANGANLDDRGDHRPGMLAAARHLVRSPLIEAGCTKAVVRALARAWGLPVWDKPAAPCLSSRIAYGVPATPERVARIDAAEQWLRQTFGLRELRVRCEAGDAARVEVPLNDVPRLQIEAVQARIVDQLKVLGFSGATIDSRGFRSGSLNEVLAADQLVVLTS
jgi:uncharacterized protein